MRSGNVAASGADAERVAGCVDIRRHAPAFMRASDKLEVRTADMDEVLSQMVSIPIAADCGLLAACAGLGGEEVPTSISRSNSFVVNLFRIHVCAAHS
jgi:hypothetical protein